MKVVVDYCLGHTMQDVSLLVPAGTSCALVGTSGSGKSTIIRLFFRFYDPQRGFIKIGNHDIQDIKVCIEYCP